MLPRDATFVRSRSVTDVFQAGLSLWEEQDDSRRGSSSSLDSAVFGRAFVSGARGALGPNREGTFFSNRTLCSSSSASRVKSFNSRSIENLASSRSCCVPSVNILDQQDTVKPVLKPTLEVSVRRKQHNVVYKSSSSETTSTSSSRSNSAPTSRCLTAAPLSPPSQTSRAGRKTRQAPGHRNTEESQSRVGPVLEAPVIHNQPGVVGHSPVNHAHATNDTLTFRQHEFSLVSNSRNH